MFNGVRFVYEFDCKDWCLLSWGNSFLYAGYRQRII